MSKTISEDRINEIMEHVEKTAGLFKAYNILKETRATLDSFQAATCTDNAMKQIQDALHYEVEQFESHSE